MIPSGPPLLLHTSCEHMHTLLARAPLHSAPDNGCLQCSRGYKKIFGGAVASILPAVGGDASFPPTFRPDSVALSKRLPVWDTGMTGLAVNHRAPQCGARDPGKAFKPAPFFSQGALCRLTCNRRFWRRPLKRTQLRT